MSTDPQSHQKTGNKSWNRKTRDWQWSVRIPIYQCVSFVNHCSPCVCKQFHGTPWHETSEMIQVLWIINHHKVRCKSSDDASLLPQLLQIICQHSELFEWSNWTNSSIIPFFHFSMSCFEIECFATYNRGSHRINSASMGRFSFGF